MQWADRWPVCYVSSPSCEEQKNEEQKRVHCPPPELLACEAAATGGHVLVLEWLQRNARPRVPTALMRFVESNRYIWSYRIMHHATLAKQAHVTRWALEMGLSEN
jgi:hypothetical protein